MRIHTAELPAIGAARGDMQRVASRRGAVSLTARGDFGTPRGSFFGALSWAEAAIDNLTDPALDPVASSSSAPRGC